MLSKPPEEKRLAQRRDRTPEIDLEPGASFRDSIDLNRLYDISRPGKYTVALEFVDTATNGGGADANGDIVKSNVLTVTVMPRLTSPIQTK